MAQKPNPSREGDEKRRVLETKMAQLPKDKSLLLARLFICSMINNEPDEKHS
jgi:hypothetical protein